MFKYLSILAVAFLLSGCSGDKLPTVNFPTTPIPHSETYIPRIGRKEFEADWSKDSIGLGLSVTQDVPPKYDLPDNFTWATFDRPGSEGQDTVDPGPNEYYHTENNILHINAGNPGFPIVSKQTFSKDKKISFEGEVAITVRDTLGFGGICVYNGEDNYRALYYEYDENGKDLIVTMYSTTFLKSLPGKYDMDTFHKLRIDYDGTGNWKYFVDDVLLLEESQGSLGIDNTILSHDPSAALWMGICEMRVRNFDVFVE